MPEILKEIWNFWLEKRNWILRRCFVCCYIYTPSLHAIHRSNPCPWWRYTVLLAIWRAFTRSVLVWLSQWKFHLFENNEKTKCMLYQRFPIKPLILAQELFRVLGVVWGFWGVVVYRSSRTVEQWNSQECRQLNKVGDEQQKRRRIQAKREHDSVVGLGWKPSSVAAVVHT